MIGIRADGNEKIGLGHIMRCLSIAHALEKLGQKPVFITVDAAEFIIKNGFDCVTLQGCYDDLSGEHAKLTSIIAQKNISLLLVDSYFADDAYFEGLQTKIAVLFDFGVVPKKADVMINYNISYGSFDYPTDKKVLLGCEYVPLRQEFTDLKLSRDVSQVKTVMITVGGADPHNLTFQILNQLVKDRFFEKIRFQVVIGSLNCYADNIKKLAKNHQNVVCLENVKKMSEVMKASDIAVSAGGSTLYEICAVQLPCVTFAFADNQYELIDVMQKKGVMRSAGKLKDGGLADKVTDCLKELIDNQKLREAFVKKEAELIDAKGAQRIAQALIEEISEK